MPHKHLDIQLLLRTRLPGWGHIGPRGGAVELSRGHPDPPIAHSPTLALLPRLLYLSSSEAPSWSGCPSRWQLGCFWCLLNEALLSLVFRVLPLLRKEPPFIEHVFTQHLLWTRCWGHRGEWNRQGPLLLSTGGGTVSKSTFEGLPRSRLLRGTSLSHGGESPGRPLASWQVRGGWPWAWVDL